MKRSIDAVLIAAVAVVTITGTVRVLQGSTRQSPIDTWVMAKWGQWHHAHAVPSLADLTSASSPSGQTGQSSAQVKPAPPAKTGGNNAATAHNSPSLTGGSWANTTGQASTTRKVNTTNQVNTTVADQWTKADVIKLEAIGTHLVYALDPEDWQQIAQALSTGEPTSAVDPTLTQILRARLPSSDRQWLVKHFTGSHAVNQQDVQLLQRSVSQAESELTPAERKLLENELNALEGKGAGTVNGIRSKTVTSAGNRASHIASKKTTSSNGQSTGRRFRHED